MGEKNVAYEYDVFISYKHGDVDFWLHNIFLKRFIFALENELGRRPVIFYDSQIQKGDTWPLRIQKCLANSRCLVAFLQPSYFASSWCLYEFGSMLKREKQEGYRSRINPNGLIQTVRVGDGIYFPDYAKQIQWLDCTDYFSASSAFEKSERCLDLEKAIKDWAIDVATTIKHAPQWKEEWAKISEVNVSLPEEPIFSLPSLD